jgi:SAM-dependent methyltransferase
MNQDATGAQSRSGAMTPDATQGYVHGYYERESRRLADQADTLVELLHHDTHYPDGTTVLEIGCGVGAQTVTLARQSPGAQITSIDISEQSLGQARDRCEEAGIGNVTFEQGNVFDLRYPDDTFDHVFVCFVLEHLAQPVEALRHMMRVLRPGGTITVIEGDHGSAFFHPYSNAAQTAINAQVALQAASGGNANIGRTLYPLLTEASAIEIVVSPRHVYVDGSKGSWIEGFTENTFIAMIEGIGPEAASAGLIEPELFRQGVADLHRTATSDGVFSYMFFKATARRNPFPHHVPVSSA